MVNNLKKSPKSPCFFAAGMLKYFLQCQGIALCGSAGIGRQARLRCVCLRRTGSSPVSRTRLKTPHGCVVFFVAHCAISAFLPSRESHFVGFAIFLPAFCIDIYFIALTQTCGAHFAHRRFFFLLKFCARAYSGYLFRQRFPAAGCRVQVANFMLMRFAIFLARAYSLHRFCYSNLASHIVWCLFFVECTSRLQTSSYGDAIPCT